MESLAYPIPALVLGLNYTTSLATHLIRNTPMSPAAPTAYDLPVLAPYAAGRGNHRAWWRHPLTFILAIQAGLSLSMVWSNTAFNDEADYLWIGHQVLSHWVHGAPWMSSWGDGFLSGSPFIYPPLGALASAAGSLAGARILSMLFILAATVFLWLTCRKLFGTAAATAAAALWVVSEPAIKLSAFATYDAMSVSLMALSSWLIIWVEGRKRRGEVVALAGAVLGLSAATAYSGLLMLPVVAVFAFLCLRTDLGNRGAASITAWFAAAAALSFAGLIQVSHSWRGLTYTVLNRQVGGVKATAYHVIQDSWSYTGLVLLLGIIGALIAVSGQERSRRLLVAFLVMCGVVVPVAQGHDQTVVSLDKHLAYGVWFTAIAAGYASGRVVELLPVLRIRRLFVALCCAIAFAYPAINGWDSASHDFQSWSNSRSFASALAAVAKQEHGLIYVTNGVMFVAAYSTSEGGDWQRWTYDFDLPYAKTLQSGTYGVVVLFYTTSISSPSLTSNMVFAQKDSSVRGELLSLVGENSRNPDLANFTLALEDSSAYRLAAVGPYDNDTADGIYAIWEKVPS